jgi:hypothetical protein
VAQGRLLNKLRSTLRSLEVPFNNYYREITIMTKKIWRITTSCKLITEYTEPGHEDETVEDVCENFSDCLFGDGKEKDYQEEEIIKVEVSKDSGISWEIARN